MAITELIEHVDGRELSVELPETLQGVSHKRVRDLVMTADEFEHGVGEPLTDAWLQLDACRSALGNTDHPAISGRLDLVAALLREAVFNLLSTAAECRTAAVENQGIARGEAQGRRLENGVAPSPCLPLRKVRQHCRQGGQPHSVIRARATCRPT